MVFIDFSMVFISFSLAPIYVFIVFIFSLVSSIFHGCFHCFSMVGTGFSMVFIVCIRQSTHLRLQNFLTCASYSLAPPTLACASDVAHLRLQYSLAPPQCYEGIVSLSLNVPPLCLPPCDHMKSKSLSKFSPPFAFHHATMWNLSLYLNFPPFAFHHATIWNVIFCLSFPPLCHPPCDHLKSKSLFKFSPLCLSPCDYPKCNFLFKLSPPLPSTMRPSKNLSLYLKFSPPLPSTMRPSEI